MEFLQRNISDRNYAYVHVEQDSEIKNIDL